MANQMGELEQYTNSQQSKVNELVNQVNKSSSQSRSNQSIPEMINTSENGASSSELSTAQALIASLQTSLTEAQRTRPPPRGRFGGRDGGRYGDRGGDGGRGHGPGRQGHRVLGEIMVNVDRRLTRRDDPNWTEKKLNNKLYCHAHGYKCAEGHDSMHCM